MIAIYQKMLKTLSRGYYLSWNTTDDGFWVHGSRREKTHWADARTRSVSFSARLANYPRRLHRQPITRLCGEWLCNPTQISGCLFSSAHAQC